MPSCLLYYPRLTKAMPGTKMCSMRRHPYEIRVAGILGKNWVEWFDGLSIHHEEDELGGQAFSILSGSLDQAALYGVLMKIRDLNLPLIAVNWMDEGGVHGPDEG